MKTLEKIIVDSLIELKNISHENSIANKNQKSNLIFPRARLNKASRISEQEARFLFIRELEKKENKHSFYYSIETPTCNIYQFSQGGKKIEPKIGEGQSASIDVTLYSKIEERFHRKHLIEFKQGNINTCKKDFLKLLFDINGLHNFYINVINRENLSKRKTLESIINKYQNAINDLIKKEQKDISKLTIILFNINDGDLRIFKEIDIRNGKVKIEENNL
ncbi:hypothetical protein ACFO5T_12670 [Dokdonia genika]|uniref:Uncharacterized protein n=1 Tax=Dokdonia genika TaxID=308113 RepID=A0ABV9LB30_9FLAO